MIVDPIVEDVRAIRDEIAKECDYDIDTLFQYFRRLEAASSVPHVTLSPRRVTEPDQEETSLPAGETVG
jgi:hypothetical protein